MVGPHDDIVAIEWSTRPSRAPDYEVESWAFVTLARVMAEAPQATMQRLVEAAVQLTGADAAGISLLEEHDGAHVFRWHAVAGAYAQHMLGVSPRNFVPETAPERAQILSHRRRPFALQNPAAPAVSESLLVPFRIDERAAGSMCLAAYDGRHQFDAEDVRVMTDLAEFGAAAVRSSRSGEAQRLAVEQLRKLVENIPDYALFMLDPDGFINQWIEPGAENVKGYKAAEILGRHVSICFTPEDVAAGEVERELRRAAEEGRIETEMWHVRKGGERFWANEVTVAVRERDGKLAGFTKVCRDLTEWKRLDDERDRAMAQERVARREAERAMKIKDEFLAVVSHELRTPLTAVLLWSQMLEAGHVEPEQYPAVFRMIRESAEAQHHLIEDLLDVSRMLSGELRLNLRPAELAPAVQAAIDIVRPMADAKGIRIDAAVDDWAGRVLADPGRVEQIVWNLLSNAIKFTDPGGAASVRLRRVNDRVQLQVSDTGVGISPEFLPHVFERFRQADTSTTRTEGGLGLGLAITQKLVELQGGTIRAESEGEGKGATFTVEFPLADVGSGLPTAGQGAGSAGAGQPFKPLPVLRGARVLVVEDNENARTVVQWTLEQCGAEVAAVASAEDALTAFRASVNGRGYDALVSDIGMSGQDGYALIRDVRALEQEAGTHHHVPAVALTAYAGEEDRSKALGAGFDAHLPKPVGAAALVRAVAESMGRGDDATA